MNSRPAIIVFITTAALLTAGCSTSATSPALTQGDPALATQAHWIAQPAVATVQHDDYDRLWEACRQTARWRGFQIDRADYRNGLLVSRPLISKQLFEVWRRDTMRVSDMAESTLATIRRIVRFEISKQEDGTFACVPKVVIERYTSTERRITTVTQYRESFSIEPEQGSREKDKGVNVPDTYWYATGRDAVLEKDLAEGIRSRVRGMAAGR